jgi:hypothetical protein
MQTVSGSRRVDDGLNAQNMNVLDVWDFRD